VASIHISTKEIRTVKTKTIAHTQVVGLINKAWTTLEFLDNITLDPVLTRCYDMALAGERQHRRGLEGQYKVAAHVAARMHVVRWLVHYSTPGVRAPTCAAMLFMRNDISLAAMIAVNYAPRIREALKQEGLPIKRIQAIDYVKLIEACPQALPE